MILLLLFLLPGVIWEIAKQHSTGGESPPVEDTPVEDTPEVTIAIDKRMSALQDAVKLYRSEWEYWDMQHKGMLRKYPEENERTIKIWKKASAARMRYTKALIDLEKYERRYEL